jgi:hypothetical protein
MTAEIQDRRPALPYAQRFVWGKVSSVEHDVLHIRLETQDYDLPISLMPQWARVRKENWPSGYQKKTMTGRTGFAGWVFYPVHPINPV